MALTSSRILILGIGNLLLTDEGLGIHAVRELQKLPGSEEVEILDGGTGGYELILHFTGREHILIIDAFQADLPAGTIVQASPEDLIFNQDFPLSVHQNGLQELLYRSRTLQPSPAIHLYGIVVKDCQSLSLELSPEVNASLPDLISLILKDVSKYLRNC